MTSAVYGYFDRTSNNNYITLSNSTDIDQLTFD